MAPTEPDAGRTMMRSRTAWVARWRAERAEAGTYCSGAENCTATTHIHGCFADAGNCDCPDEHTQGAYSTVTDSAEGRYESAE